MALAQRQVQPAVASAWAAATAALEKASTSGDVASAVAAATAADELHVAGLTPLLEDWLTDLHAEDLASAARDLAKAFPTDEPADALDTMGDEADQQFALAAQCQSLLRLTGALQGAVSRITAAARTMGRAIDAEKVGRALRDRIYLTLLATLPSDANQRLARLLDRAFLWAHGETDEEGDEDEERPAQRDAAALREEHQHTLRQLHAAWAELGLMRRLFCNAVADFASAAIRRQAKSLCEDDLYTQQRQPLEAWYNDHLGVFLADVLCEHGLRSAFDDRLRMLLLEALAYARVKDLFDIIVEFPDSMEAVTDLKECMTSTNIRPVLISELRQALEKRLLHPGAQTSDIITQYVSAVKTLRVLDPAGVILEVVCEPVRAYLRQRADTVRSVVMALTDEDSNEWQEAFRNTASADQQRVPGLRKPTMDWLPDPIDALPVDETQSDLREGDIVQLLISIYGNTEAFVNEYRTLLADRLLAQKDYIAEREIRNIELLKLRFGEDHLGVCGVMLKDFADSKRTHTNFKEVTRGTPLPQGQEHRAYEDVHVFVLSRLFWPTLKEDTFALPPELAGFFEEYTEAFKKLKPARTLELRPTLGTVDLTIELASGPVDVSVAPLAAAILMKFQEKPQWSLEELSAALKAPAAAVRSRMAVWRNMGILVEETSNIFTLHEEGGAGDGMDLQPDEEETSVPNADDVMHAQLEAAWKYIHGMLVNLKTLPLERIEAMLKMFMTGDNAFGGTKEDLKRYLDKKVADDELRFENNMYALP